MTQHDLASLCWATSLPFNAMLLLLRRAIDLLMKRTRQRRGNGGSGIEVDEIGLYCLWKMNLGNRHHHRAVGNMQRNRQESDSSRPSIQEPAKSNCMPLILNR